MKKKKKVAWKKSLDVEQSTPYVKSLDVSCANGNSWLCPNHSLGGSCRLPLSLIVHARSAWSHDGSTGVGAGGEVGVGVGDGVGKSSARFASENACGVQALHLFKFNWT